MFSFLLLDLSICVSACEFISFKIVFSFLLYFVCQMGINNEYTYIELSDISGCWRKEVVLFQIDLFNILSFQACLCACFICYDCNYFSYWSSTSSSTCQSYNTLQEKKQMLGVIRERSDRIIYCSTKLSRKCKWSTNLMLTDWTYFIARNK